MTEGMFIMGVIIVTLSCLLALVKLIHSNNKVTKLVTTSSAIIQVGLLYAWRSPGVLLILASILIVTLRANKYLEA